jgi:hypothetical protein
MADEPIRGPSWPFPAFVGVPSQLQAKPAHPLMEKLVSASGNMISRELWEACPIIGVRDGHNVHRMPNGTEVFGDPAESTQRPARPALSIDTDMVERACRAHWQSFDRMRPDHAAEKRVKMQSALAAALYGGRLKP